LGSTGFCVVSDRSASAFSGPDTNTVFQRSDEDLAVTDFASVGALGRSHDCLNGDIDKCIVDGDIQPGLGDQIGNDLFATVDIFKASRT
jgi:hypothetical protein